MVSRIRGLVLFTKQLEHGTLDDTVTWHKQHVIAHVTEVNGAQLQNDLFDKQYSMTWVARVRGNRQADAVAFPINGTNDEQLEKMDVVQIRKHANRTDIYFAKDREVSADELEQ